MSVAARVEEDRRRLLLTALLEAGGQANAVILAGALRRLGHTVDADAALAQALWLMGIGAADVEMLDTVARISLTDFGADLARGDGSVPGVRPLRFDERRRLEG